MRKVFKAEKIDYLVVAIFCAAYVALVRGGQLPIAGLVGMWVGQYVVTVLLSLWGARKALYITALVLAFLGFLGR